MQRASTPATSHRRFEAAFAAFHIDDLVSRINGLDGKAPAAGADHHVGRDGGEPAHAGRNASRPNPSSCAQARSPRWSSAIAQPVAEVPCAPPHGAVAAGAGRVEARAEKYRAAERQADIAHDVALVRALASARETVEIAEQTKWPLKAALFVQHQVGEQLGLDRMRSAARDLEPRDHWDRLALQRVADDLPRQQSELTIAAIRMAQKAKVSPARLDREAAGKLVERLDCPAQGPCRPSDATDGGIRQARRVVARQVGAAGRRGARIRLRLPHRSKRLTILPE